MTKVKFNAWLVEEQQMINADMLFVNQESYNGSASLQTILDNIANNDIILLQDTLEVDSSGKSIHDGDIVKITNSYDEDPVLAEVHFIWGGFKVTYQYDDSNIWSIGYLLEQDGITVEVVGNKFENPQLLQQIEEQPSQV